MIFRDIEAAHGPSDWWRSADHVLDSDDPDPEIKSRRKFVHCPCRHFIL